MATCMDVFQRVMHLHDDNDENTGDYDIPDTKEYKLRLLSIYNTIVCELYPYSDTSSHVAGKRAVPAPMTSLTDEIDLDDYCIEVMVYGVAARMFTTEDAASASFYEQEYERRLGKLEQGAGMASESDSIEDVYGGGYYDEDGVWHAFTGWFPWNYFSRW